MPARAKPLPDRSVACFDDAGGSINLAIAQGKIDIPNNDPYESAADASSGPQSQAVMCAHPPHFAATRRSSRTLFDGFSRLTRRNDRTLMR